MKRNCTAGLACWMVLTLFAFAAPAAEGERGWTNKLAELSIQGAFEPWGLEEKVRFVEVMREDGRAMDEADYAALMNPRLDVEARLEAAHQIIDDRYGDRMRAHAATWVEPPETVWGMAPDAMIIFQEAYDARHPEADEQEYRDALAYWIRDMNRRQEASAAGAGAEKPAVDEAVAARVTEAVLLEYFSLPESDADQLDTRVAFVEEHRVWVCEASFPKTLAAFPADIEPAGSPVQDLGDAWGMRVLVDRDGNAWRGYTLEAYLAETAAAPIWHLTGAACEEIARQGVMRTFGLSAEEVDVYFIFSGEVYQDDHRNALVTMIFKPHSNGVTDDWLYAAMVNAGTGELVDCVDREGLWAKLPAYAEAYPTLTEEERLAWERWLLHGPYNPYGGCEHWTEAQKAAWNALLGQYKAVE